MGKFIDISGVRFGRLVAKERVGTDKHGSPLWRVTCDCGREKVVSRTGLSHTKSCGCLRQDDLTGKRFGRLVVLGRADSQRGDMRWKCQCDCGNTTVAVGNALKRGQTKSCKCLRKESQRLAVKAHSLLPGESARNVVIGRYKTQAKNKTLSWLLSDKEVLSLMSQACCYCGRPPSNQTNLPKHNGDYRYNGLDRLDNGGGYTLANVVPCCWECNWMKRSLTPERFLGHVREIQAYQDKGTTAHIGEAPK